MIGLDRGKDLKIREDLLRSEVAWTLDSIAKISSIKLRTVWGAYISRWIARPDVNFEPWWYWNCENGEGLKALARKTTFWTNQGWNESA